MRVERNEKYKTISTRPHEDDTRLSWQAAGVLTYLITRPDGWTFHRRDIVHRGSDGRDAVKSALRELEELGYLSRTQGRGPQGQFGRRQWTVSEVPIPDWAANEDETLRMLTEWGFHPETDFPSTGSPSTGSPSTGSPSTENPSHNIEQQTSKKFTKDAGSARTREGKPSRGDAAASPARRGEKEEKEETAGRGDAASADPEGFARDVNSLTPPSDDDPEDVVCHLEGEPVRVAKGEGGQTCVRWRDRAPTYLPPRLGPGRISDTLSPEQARATLRDNPKTAARLARMPDTLGDHPDGGTVQLGISSGGPYVRHKAASGKTLSIEDVNSDTPALKLGLEGALNILRYGGPVKNDQRAGTDSYGNPTGASSHDAGQPRSRTDKQGGDDVIKTLPDGRRVTRSQMGDGFDVEQYEPGSNIWEYTTKSLEELMEELNEG